MVAINLKGFNGEVLSPASEAELSELLASASSRGKAVLPFGAGTKLGWGSPLRRVDLALSTSAMGRVVEYDPADLTIAVQAGMKFSRLQELLKSNRQFLPFDPPYWDEATIGGIVACNATGPLRYAYGAPRDTIIGMKVAHADGTLSKSGGRVVKNVAGFDLHKLYTGSFGTLCVITQINFKLYPLPEVERTAVACFANYAEALEGAKRVIASHLVPLAMEVLDPAAARCLGLEPAFNLAIRFGGSERAVEWQQRETSERILSGHQVELIAGEQHEQFWHNIAGLRVLLRSERAPLVLKVGAGFRAMPEIYQDLCGLAEHAGAELCSTSRAGSGLIYAYLSGLPEEHSDLVLRIKELRARLGSAGSLTIEEGPDDLKLAAGPWNDFGAALPLMRAIKEKFDPSGILSPGRFYHW